MRGISTAHLNSPTRSGALTPFRDILAILQERKKQREVRSTQALPPHSILAGRNPSWSGVFPLFPTLPAMLSCPELGRSTAQHFSDCMRLQSCLQLTSRKITFCNRMLSRGVSQVVLVVKNLPANAGDVRDVSKAACR